MRQSSQFSNYNFREYARRRTRDAFREHQKEGEERKIQEFIQEGLKNLRMMKVTIPLLICGLQRLIDFFLNGKETNCYQSVLSIRSIGRGGAEDGMSIFEIFVINQS
jgi:hypothetical protein